MEERIEKLENRLSDCNEYLQQIKEERKNLNKAISALEKIGENITDLEKRITECDSYETAIKEEKKNIETALKALYPLSKENERPEEEAEPQEPETLQPVIPHEQPDKMPEVNTEYVKVV